jgi:hypothetical protein
MTRPTKGQVDAAIEHYYEEAQCAIERNCAGVLAAEVHALRVELAEAHRKLDLFREASETAELLRLVDMRQALEKADHSVEEALEARDRWHGIAHRQKAALERVEALPAKWRTGWIEDRVGWFAEQLEEALRGQS